MKPGIYEPYRIADVHRASAQDLFSQLTMFAGGGGACLGSHMAGGRVVLASEFVPEAARTYGLNFPDVAVDTRDMREITLDAVGVDRFLSMAGLKIGELDVMHGSPPCCEFSTAKKGIISDQNQKRRYSDVKQSGIAGLIFDYHKLAKVVAPKVVITENIPALQIRHRYVFEGALEELRYSSGTRERAYFVASSLLSAADFGVAQNRQRLFVIGIRRDVGEAIGITSDEHAESVFPESTHSPVSVRQALSGLLQTSAQVEPWFRAMRVSALARVVECLPKNPTRCIRPCHIDGLDKGRNFNLVRCAWDSSACTLAAAAQRPDGLSGAIHPDLDRKFTIPELKRLFGLPDDYILTGTLGQAAERICRMVTPFVMRALAEAVYQRVLVPYAERRR